MKALGFAALQLQVARVAQTLSGLAAGVMLGRAVGPAGLGEYAFALAAAVLVQSVVSLGFEDLVLARGPRSGGDTQEARAFYARTLRTRVLVGVLLAALSVGVSLAGAGHHAALIGVYAALNGVATLGAAIQSARRMPLVSAMLDTTWAVLVICGYAILLALGDLTVGRALVIIVVAQLAADWGYLLNLRKILLTRPDRLRLNDFVLFWLNGLLNFGAGKNSDVLAMRAASASSTDIGLYNAAFSTNQAASQFLLQGTGTMFYVGLGGVFRGNQPDRIAQAWRAVVVASALLSVPLLIFCAFFSTAVISTIYGQQYDSAGPTFVILALATVVARALGGGANQSLLFLAERQRQVIVVRAGCVVANLLADVLAYHIAGTEGVAVAAGASLIAISGIEFLLARRIVPLKLPISQLLRLTVPFVLASLAASSLVPSDPSVTLTLLTGMATTVVGTLGLFVSKPLNGLSTGKRHPILSRLGAS